jgi:DivIVA domain-containing protein
VSTGFELSGEGNAAEESEGGQELRPTFGSVRRGYDPREVDAFLTSVVSGIKTLEAKVRELPEDMPEEVDDRLAERFARILMVQEQEAEDILAEAHLDADAMVAAAKQEAERILTEGQDAAKRSIQEATAFRRRAVEESDQLRADLVERRRETIANLPKVQQRLLAFLHEVQAMLGSIEAQGRAARSTSEEVVEEDATTN